MKSIYGSLAFGAVGDHIETSPHECLAWTYPTQCTISKRWITNCHVFSRSFISYLHVVFKEAIVKASVEIGFSEVNVPKMSLIYFQPFCNFAQLVTEITMPGNFVSSGTGLTRLGQFSSAANLQEWCSFGVFFSGSNLKGFAQKEFCNSEQNVETFILKVVNRLVISVVACWVALLHNISFT